MKKYQIIYADPPWSFKNYSDKWHKNRVGSKWVGNQYDCLTKQDIRDLQVSNVCHENCILFLWVTMPSLIEGIELCKEWGFEYKTCGFVWVKRNKVSPSWFWGMGFWTRANAELCLIGTKGHPKRLAKNVHQIIDTPIQRHSQKPDCTKDKIVQLMGDIPRIELFARQKTEGWDVWGNEVESDIILIPKA